MSKRIFIEEAEVRRLSFLKKEASRLNALLLAITPQTDKAEKERIEEEYRRVVEEEDFLSQSISYKIERIKRIIEGIREKPQSTSLESFDEAIKDFNDSLYDYYESCKERLRAMEENIDLLPEKKGSFLLAFYKWRLRRRIRKEIAYYTRLQQEESAY